MGYSGVQENWLMKKLKTENLVSDSLYDLNIWSRKKYIHKLLGYNFTSTG